MTNFQFRPFRRSWRKEFGGKQAPETMTCLLLILRKWQEVLNQYIHCVQDQCSFPSEGGLGLMKYQCSGRMDCFSRKELVENICHKVFFMAGFLAWKNVKINVRKYSVNFVLVFCGTSLLWHCQQETHSQQTLPQKTETLKKLEETFLLQ